MYILICLKNKNNVENFKILKTTYNNFIAIFASFTHVPSAVLESGSCLNQPEIANHLERLNNHCRLTFDIFEICHIYSQDKGEDLELLDLYIIFFL